MFCDNTDDCSEDDELCNNNNNNNLSFNMVKATAQPYKHTVRTTTVCHTGQQWHGSHTVTQDSSNQFSTEGVGCQKQTAPSFASNPIRPGLYLTSIHQMVPQKRGSTHLIIALLLIYWPWKEEQLIIRIKIIIDNITVCVVCVLN